LGRLDENQAGCGGIASFFLLVAGAQAFHWHLGYGQAKHSSREFAEVACKHEHLCTGFGVGSCQRASDSRIDCEVGLFYADQPQPGEEAECNLMLHWGVDRSGALALKNAGKPHCFTVT
jgi:hypothetical protein